MTWQPKSLWGRISLLLLGVLVVAQLLSAALHFQDRGEILKYASGYNAAQRIAGMVRLLDALTPDQRTMAVTELDVPPLRVELRETPRKQPDIDRMSPRAELFHQMLHFRLGDERPVSLYMPKDNSLPATATKAPAPHSEMMARLTSSVSYHFVVQVELQGGQWVVFNYRLPLELAAWPWDLLVGLSILLLTVLVVSFYAVRWVIRPLSELSSAADHLGKDIGYPPLHEDGPLEVARAAKAFNTMQLRIARFIEERTRLLAAVSHDLKTPITRMRLRAEKIGDPALRAKFDTDLEDMQTLVQSSLDFMRGVALHEKTLPLDINALIQSLTEDARDTGHVIQVVGKADSPYPSKPLALKRCLGNLIDNALRYGDDVCIKIEDDTSCLTIHVQDQGPGLADDLLNKVFEPFFRVEQSRNASTGGTGLGLSIARNIARGHGGELKLENRREGGLDAKLILPR